MKSKGKDKICEDEMCEDKGTREKPSKSSFAWLCTSSISSTVRVRDRDRVRVRVRVRVRRKLYIINVSYDLIPHIVYPAISLHTPNVLYHQRLI